jgi:uncharacterized membrane protein
MNTANSTPSGEPLPRSIPEYLEQLRHALTGADPALLQDALYDAEEYLRSELAENPGKSEAEVIAAVASSYGAPEEVADIYRDTEVKVQAALRPPRPPKQRSLLGRFFGVVADPRAYAALFYMLLSLVTGIFYFTWVTTGAALSLGLAILIIGIPFVILFFASVRVLSLVEGRIVEVMLGERMPRRPVYVDREKSLLSRIGEMFTDPRTWTTMLYFLLMQPLGTFYFSVAITLIALSLACVAVPVLVWVGFGSIDTSGGWPLALFSGDGVTTTLAAWMLPLCLVVGVLLFFLTLHLSRGIGKVHGLIAKHLLVRA